MVGNSWFWFVGAIYLTQIPAYAKEWLYGDETVVTLILTVFSVGIALGSMLCEKLSGRKVEIGLVPFGSFGLTLFGLLWWWHSGDVPAAAAPRDWLALLGLETMRGEYLCYSLPVQREGWLSKTRFLEQAGDRWWPAAGGVYCLDVVKRVKGMRIIEPQWCRVPNPKARPAAVAEKTPINKEIK